MARALLAFVFALMAVQRAQAHSPMAPQQWIDFWSRAEGKIFNFLSD